MGDIFRIVEILEGVYPEAICSLEHGGEPWRMLVMARLSAQCTDERVNIVSKRLFERFSDVHAMAEADVAAVEEIVKPCGLYRAKAASIVNAAKILVEKYGGEVPRTMDKLLELPGIGRKIANLILGDAYGVPGIVADTHCIRINGRLGFYDTSLKDAAKVERILAAIVPPQKQSDYCHRMVLFGREYCTARSPKCGNCPLTSECLYNNKE